MREDNMSGVTVRHHEEEEEDDDPRTFGVLPTVKDVSFPFVEELLFGVLWDLLLPTAPSPPAFGTEEPERPAGGIANPTPGQRPATSGGGVFPAKSPSYPLPSGPVDPLLPLAAACLLGKHRPLLGVRCALVRLQRRTVACRHLPLVYLAIYLSLSARSSARNAASRPHGDPSFLSESQDDGRGGGLDRGISLGCCPCDHLVLGLNIHIQKKTVHLPPSNMSPSPLSLSLSFAIFPGCRNKVGSTLINSCAEC